MNHIPESDANRIKWFGHLGNAGSSDFSAARRHDITVRKLTQRVCKAKIAGREETFAELREVLETSFLSDQQAVTYRLVWQLYHPIDRWRDGSVISSFGLGEYQVRRPGN